MTPTGTNVETDEEWQAYDPVEGSFVELLADGSFRLEGVDAVFAPADAANEENATLTARKEGGTDKPLYITLHQGATPLTVALRFDPSDKRWYRRDAVPTPGSPGTQVVTETTSEPVARRSFRPFALLAGTDGERFFKVAFFLFVGWYLFVFHGVFRGKSPDDEVLPDYPSAEATAPSPSPGPSTDSGPGKDGKILYDGGYNSKPPGWD